MDNKLLLKKMLTIRLEQERVEKEYSGDTIATPIHMSTGQEAIAVGVCECLTNDDWVVSNYRSHAHYLARGGSLPLLIAELFGKETGCSKGRGGSMNLISLENKFMGTSAIVAGNVPIGVGMAFANKIQQKDGIVVIFHGDGATEEGVFYEALNYAIFQNLKVLFVCENNNFACNTKIHERVFVQDIYKRLESLGIKTCFGDGNNIYDVIEKTKNCINYINKHNKPSFIELKTMCVKEHVGVGSKHRETYFSKDEWSYWKSNDPIFNLAKQFSFLELYNILSEVIADVNAAWSFANDSPLPDIKNIMDYVYAN